MLENLLIEIDNHIAKLIINNPPANTWDQESLSFLKKSIEELNDNKEIFSLVITGKGEKFFSAGADLKVFDKGGKEAANEMATSFATAFSALSNFRGVSIASINGFAMGGGLECALACDIRIAEKQAKLALPEPKVGLLPCGGGTQQLPRLVGEGWAKRMILAGEQVDAELGLKIGLVEEVVETGESYTKGIELAEQVCNQSPLSISACKALIHSARSQQNSYESEKKPFVELFDTQDQKEGVSAFLEKRPPKWRNA